MHDIKITKQISTIPEYYLSFAIDLAQIIGKDWWDKSKRKILGLSGNAKQDKFDFNNIALRKLTKKLAPAILRIGGSKSDEVYYQIKENDETPPDILKGYKDVLSCSDIDSIINFTKYCNLKLFFTLNAGSGPRYKKNINFENTFNLIDYLQKKRADILGYEFGNELNSFILRGLKNRISGKRYAKEFDILNKEIKQRDKKILLSGCSGAYWPKVGEILGVTKPFLRSTENDVDIISWHYYPQQSSRAPVHTRKAKVNTLLNPKNLNEVLKWNKKIMKLKKKYSSSSQIWMTETGHAQCGGEPEISDTFISSFWWLDQLGLLAKNECKVIVRQTLTGGDYGLIDYDTMNPNPDYWATILWKKLMGNEVYETTYKKTKSNLRVYAHKTKNEVKKITFLFINLNKKKKKKIVFDDTNSEKKEIYEITANSLISKEVYLNEQELKIKESIIPEIKPKIVSTNKIEIKPLSYLFIVTEPKE
jgi:heparanase